MATMRECERIREQLAELLEGEVDADLQQHLVTCDACRDLRHEAQMAADAVREAGGDFVPPPAEEIERRLWAALDARVEQAASGGERVERITLSDGTPAVRATVTKTVETPVHAAPKGAPVVRAEKTNVIPLVPRSRRFWIAGSVLALAAAAVPFVVRHGRGSTPMQTSPREAALADARAAWHGRLGTIARAAADRTGGVEVKLPGALAFVTAHEGMDLPAGTEVRTDDRTRGRVELSDGTRLVLDRGTVMALDATHPRAASLRTGALVADVAHLDDGSPHADIGLPGGHVSVLGTKFSLTASQDRSTVRVTRGVVRLAGVSGAEVEVKTGEEGVVGTGANPAVSPAVDLASSVAWSDLGNEMRVEPEAPIVGLGELRARRPGHTDEGDHQVSLATHTVRVRVVGNMARTEIDEIFRNDTANELEGIYRFPLPPEAQIEKLALDVHGVMQSGEFVDRQRAAAIWHGVIQNAVHPIQQAQQTDELVWVPGPWRDPALLEWQRGGRFELRIFPIPAHGTRHVAIAYTQTLPVEGGLRRYVYPLAHDANGSTRVEQFDVDVQVMGNDPTAGVRAHGYPLTVDNTGAPAGATHLAFSQGGFIPAGDLVVEYALPDRGAPVTAWAFQPPPVTPAPVTAPTRAAVVPVTATEPESAYVALALRPALPRWADVRPRDYALVVDASRSMVGERFARAGRLVRAMIAEMDPRDRVVVLACDTQCRSMSGGMQFAGGAAVHAAELFLASEEPMGGSDLVAQVRAAGQLLGRSADRDGRVVYFGDGAATVGYRRPEWVSAEVMDALPAGHASLTTVALGNDADTTLLGAMARAGGGVSVPYAPGESLQTAALNVLEATFGIALRDPVLELPAGLTEVTPSRLATIRAGGEAIVVARMAAREVRGEAVLRGTVGGEPFEARYPLVVRATDQAGNAFVPRLFAATRIAALEEGDALTAHDEIVSLSQRFHVASRFTSLLVLESEAMYRAFGVQHGGPGAYSAWTGGDVAVQTVAMPTPAPSVPTASVLTGGVPAGEVTAAMEGAASDREMNGVADLARASAPAADTAMMATRRARTVTGADDEESDAAPTDPAAGGDAHGVGFGSGHGLGLAGRGAGGGGAFGAPAAQPGVGQLRGAMSTPPVVQAAPRPMMEPSTDGHIAHRASVADAATSGVAPPARIERGPVTRGEWMRQVWVRHASVDGDRSARDGERSHVEIARAALEALPDSKTRHQELFRWLSIAGQLDEANDIATRWSTRDALDPDALTRLADVAARRGDRDRAVRILGGVVDVRPDDVNVQKRLAVLHERSGEREQACAFRVSLAQLQPRDVTAQADAVRCEQALGHVTAAGRLLAAIVDETVRQRVQSAVLAPPAASLSQAPRGDLVLEASWDVPADLDLAIIDAQGNRVSWMGGRNAGITTRGVHDLHGEGLGLGRTSSGDYVLEVSRATADARTVSGRVDVNALGQSHRTLSFTLTPGQQTARLGHVTVTREMQLVPAYTTP